MPRMRKLSPMWKLSIKLVVIIIAVVLAGCETLPEKQTATQPVMPAGAKASYAQAVSAVKAGQDTKAIQLFTGLTQEYPNFSASFTNLGLLYLKQEKLTEAEHAFKQAITINPADAVAYNHLGVVFRQRGQFEQARQAYENALRIKPGYASAHLNLGILNDIYLQNLETALQHYQRYQNLTGDADQQVAKWIVDLERRVNSSDSAGGKQG
jgi:Flp pilus assembly protein TadD